MKKFTYTEIKGFIERCKAESKCPIGGYRILTMYIPEHGMIDAVNRCVI